MVKELVTVPLALSGSLLSRSTLALFIDAFGISDVHADQLWRLWDGSGKISVAKISERKFRRSQICPRKVSVLEVSTCQNGTT